MRVDGSTIRARAMGSRWMPTAMPCPAAREFHFTTVSLTPLTGTTLTGKVVDPGADLKPMTLDDLRAGPDGVLYSGDDVFLLPIAACQGLDRRPGRSSGLSDSQGNFHFDAVPAGNVKLAIDGRTATNAAGRNLFSRDGDGLMIDAGQSNTVMGTMGSLVEREASRDRQEVYLPRLESSILHDVSGDQPTTIGVDARSAPNLTPEQRSLLTYSSSTGQSARSRRQYAGQRPGRDQHGAAGTGPRDAAAGRLAAHVRHHGAGAGDHEFLRAGTDDVSQHVRRRTGHAAQLPQLRPHDRPSGH